MSRFLVPGFVLFGAALAWLPAQDGRSGSTRSDEVDFARQIRPVLSRSCFPCHGPDASHRKAGLRLDERQGVLADLGAGRRAVVPGERENSLIWNRITHSDPDERMPPTESGHTLSSDEIALIGRWIDTGAPWAQHWSFIRPVRPKLPAVADDGWTRNPIDRFVASRRDRAGLKPSPEAGPWELVRRLSLDLTGVPPTPEEARGFVQDASEDAYEKLVDRLLASPRYGERMARPWLDLARYADSTGYASDPRRSIWRYRDWVIDAFNANMPFDRFTMEQLAGDLLPDASTSTRLATGFHRNTLTNTEGGTDDEEFRVAAVKDRVETTLQVWMGLTLGCAECHTHKFDPITHDDYYSLFAFFNQTEDSDRPGDPPRIEAPTVSEAKRRDSLDAEVAALEKELASAPGVDRRQRQWEARARRGIRWTPLMPVAATATNGATLRVLEDGSIVAEGPSPATSVYTVTVEPKLRGISAVRIEALPREGLPAGGPGRGNGNFVLNDLEVLGAPLKSDPVQGRHLRIDLPGKGRILSLAEVEIISGGRNVAVGGSARQSSTAYAGPAGFAIDGNTSGRYTDQSTTHTATEADPWWEVDLGREAPIDRIVIWNRTDGQVHTRMAGAVITVRGGDGGVRLTTRLRKAPRIKVSIDPAKDGMSVFLSHPTASFSQDQWGVARAIDADPGKGSGWAVSPRFGKAHEAVFETGAALGSSPMRLTFVLAQNYGSAHTLGYFRLSATAAPAPVGVLPADVRAALEVPRSRRTKGQRKVVRDHYVSLDPALADVRTRLVGKRAARKALKVATTPVMKELPPDRHRKTFVLEKGNFLIKLREVEAAVPAALHSWPESLPRDRFGLAQWLVSPENPLAARVLANRLWSMLFGKGLIETEEDFGSQGTPPSHPQLLDWLAVELVENGWDVKRLLRQIVTSATYRQSSVSREDLLRQDPDNRLFARGARFRLEAEAVRDQALVLAGLLSDKMHGPSVFPFQPKGLWQAAFDGDRRWPMSTGEDRYRRSLYTFLRRTVPHPSLAMFDMPSREVCAIRRIETNTPLQALVTLNDPMHVEAAQGLARRILREGGTGDGERLRFALQLCLVRPADPRAVAKLRTLLDRERKEYAERPDDARAFATDPIGALPDGADPVEFAAWTVVANVMLNLDGVLTRR